MAIGGNGFGWGNSGTALGLADIQASLYNQTQDANSRSLAGSLASVNDTVLNNKAILDLFFRLLLSDLNQHLNGNAKCSTQPCT